jgi:hypothetical protein
MKIKAAIAISVIIATSGCAHQIERDVPVSQPAKHVYEKNYNLNAVKVASVGEPLIQVKDYYVTKVGQPVMTATSSFSIVGTLVNEVFDSSRKLEVKGKTSIDGISYTIAAFRYEGDGYQALLVRDDGTVHNKVANYSRQVGGVIPMIYTYKITPEVAKVVRAEEEKVAVEKGYQNYEILYTGVDKNAMRFTYREFTPDGIARTAFYQDLTYEPNASYIRFKGFKINILKAGSEEVKFSVVADSL